MWLDALDHQIGLNLVIWAFPLIFFLHDLEEILTMERFSRRYRDRFPKWMRPLATITTAQFTIAVAIFFVLTLLAAFLATRHPADFTFFSLLLAIFLIHVITHVVQPLIFRAYTPGVITAILLVLPYSLYGFHRLFLAGLVSTGSFMISLLIGAVLLAPAILLVRQLGKLLHRPSP